MLYRIIMSLAIVFMIYSYISPYNYVSELFLSFLPYVVLFFVFVTFFWVVKLGFYFLKNKNKFFKMEAVIFVLISIIFVFISLRPVLQFYNNSEFDFDCENGISVLFANLFRDNENYEDIKKLVDENDPDLLMFVEFSADHYDHLHSFLEEKYPYINRTTWSKRTMVGSMVFSKYPIDDLSDDFEQEAWRYGYFSLEWNGAPYYFYLVHTSSPVSKTFFEMRNRQLDSFVENFQHHGGFRNGDAVVVAVGDFNLSPWSIFYDKLISALGDGVVDISASRGMIFSWNWEFLGVKIPFLMSHIDHIFSSYADSVIFDRVMAVPGSDHRGLSFCVE